MPKEVFNKLSANLRGSVITPESSEYEVARKVYNGMIDRRPDAIARCADVADVRVAVNFARARATHSRNSRRRPQRCRTRPL
jgi:hypothetical protein